MAASPPLVALIGFMGCGKSTVGALLAERLGFRFLDLDDLIEQRAGKPIRRIFDEDGEEAFRELESRALQALGTLPGTAADAPQGAAPNAQGAAGLVLAAGGGAPLRPENRRWFRERAVTFYLEISFQTFLKRTGGDPTRPLLLKSREELRSLYQSRLSIYRETGRRVDADARGPAGVTGEILRLLRRDASRLEPGAS